MKMKTAGFVVSLSLSLYLLARTLVDVWNGLDCIDRLLSQMLLMLSHSVRVLVDFL
jgi:hypothetical protein